MRVLQFTHHESGRCTDKTLPQTRVSTGARSSGNAKQWETICLSLTPDSAGDYPHVHIDISFTREEAERVARQINEYLTKKE